MEKPGSTSSHGDFTQRFPSILGVVSPKSMSPVWYSQLSCSSLRTLSIICFLLEFIELEPDFWGAKTSEMSTHPLPAVLDATLNSIQFLGLILLTHNKTLSSAKNLPLSKVFFSSWNKPRLVCCSQAQATVTSMWETTARINCTDFLGQNVYKKLINK